jgi:hypothetical protein
MPGIVVHAYPTGNIMTLATFASTNSLDVDITELRNGKWFAKINAYAPAYYNSTERKNVPRLQIATKEFGSQAEAQAELAKQLTTLNIIELTNGTKLNISTIRVTPT